jgi:Helix-turn-helix domain of alkylmercury lyase
MRPPPRSATTRGCDPGVADPLFTTGERRIAVALYRLLAACHPVAAGAVAAWLGTDVPTVERTVEGWPGVFRGDDGRVVGFWGLAVQKVAHRFRAEGGKPIYAWCALDLFLIVPVIRRTARVGARPIPTPASRSR